MSSPIRVLLADDHAVVRAGIRQYLEQAAEIEIVAEAGDGQEAVDLIQHYQPDVAVLDIQMPRMSGIEVARWVRKQLPHIGILVLTSYDDDPYVIAVLQAGAHGYVLKTAPPASIVEAVRDVNEGRRVLDPEIARKVSAQIADQTNPAADTLTERECEVLVLAGKGFTNKAIGVQLGISSRTVQGHLARIYGKLEAGSRTEAVMRAVSLGLIDPPMKK